MSGTGSREQRELTSNAMRQIQVRSRSCKVAYELVSKRIVQQGTRGQQTYEDHPGLPLVRRQRRFSLPVQVHLVRHPDGDSDSQPGERVGRLLPVDLAQDALDETEGRATVDDATTDQLHGV